MGCFNYVCAVSGLPIIAGDKVRFLMLTKTPYEGSISLISTDWCVRALPLRAQYNEYGSVENVEDGLQRDCWMRGLQIDLIERGVGENTVHDVATSKDMSFDDLLEALWEQRVLVSREVETMRSRRPPRLPSCTSRKDIAAFVREMERQAEYAPAMVMMGRITGRLKVSRVRPLLVRQAMIREDVWQALLRMRNPEIPTFRAYRKLVAHVVRSIDDLRGARLADRSAWVVEWMFKDVIPYIIGVGTHICIAHKAGVPSGTLVDSIAELAYVQIMLGRMGYVWRPGDAGSQDPAWSMHARFHRELHRIAREEARAEAAEADAD